MVEAGLAVIRFRGPRRRGALAIWYELDVLPSNLSAAASGWPIEVLACDINVKSGRS